MSRINIPFREWSCPQIIVEANDEILKGDGFIQLGETGELSIIVNLDAALVADQDLLGPTNIRGESDKGFTFSSEHAYTLQSPRKADHEATLVFVAPICTLSNPTAPLEGWSSRKYYIKNAKLFGGRGEKTSLSHSGYQIALEALPSQMPHPHLSGILSSVLEISRTDTVCEGSLNDIEAAIFALLTLAQRCPIMAPLTEIYTGDTLAQCKIIDHSLHYNVSNPLINRELSHIKDFLEQTLPNFLIQKNNYELHTLIEYYWRACVDETAEVKFIFSTVFMEALKFHWAKNVSLLKRDIKKNGLTRSFYERTRKKSGDPVPVPFEELMNKVANHLGYPQDQFTFIENRNSLFHSGQPAASQQGQLNSYQFLRPELVKLMDQMDDLLLLILGYSGEIHSYWNPGQRLRFPGRHIL